MGSNHAPEYGRPTALCGQRAPRAARSRTIVTERSGALPNGTAIGSPMLRPYQTDSTVGGEDAATVEHGDTV